MLFVCIPLLNRSVAVWANKRPKPLMFYQQADKTKHNEASQHYDTGKPFGRPREVQVKTKAKCERQRKRRDPELPTLQARAIGIKALSFFRCRQPGRLRNFKSFCGWRFDRRRKKSQVIELADRPLRWLGLQHHSRAAAVQFQCSQFECNHSART